jgi:hypothetical protein
LAGFIGQFFVPPSDRLSVVDRIAPGIRGMLPLPAAVIPMSAQRV